MNFFSSLYPPLSERSSIPAPYQPAAFALTVVPFLTSHRRAAIWTTFPPLVYLCLNSPRYTFGDPSSDYYSSGPFMAMLFWYFDLVVCTPAQGPGAPAFLGSPRTDTAQQQDAITQPDSKLTWPRLAWAFRLMLPSHRGIGWNWQVKGIPPDPYANLTKRSYIQIQICWAVFAYIRSVIMLVIMGYSTAKEKRYGSESQSLTYYIISAAVGWSGAIWVWDRLNCFYSLAAALSIALGICNVWEFPPLTGDIGDAWSVRQMWSVVYHQVLRRFVSKPAARIARLFRLRKGSLASRYLQLYLSFSISCMYHEFEMFNVTRRDMGEFAFFMSQPMAITFEDLIQSLWRTALNEGQRHRLRPVARAIGYVWVLLWFSYSLPFYLKGLRDAEIIRDGIFGIRPFEIGSDVAQTIGGS